MAEFLEVKSFSQSPVACNLVGVAAFQERQNATQALFGDCQQVTELADGYAFQFAVTPVQVARLVEYILTERACCPFFTFDLLFEPDNGPVWLQMCGPAGTKGLLQSLVGLVV